MKKSLGSQKVQIESTGIRNQVAALIAAGVEPTLFFQVAIHDGMPSLWYLLDAPVKFEAAPDLFCLDLYKEFDIDRLAMVAKPAKITQKYQ